MKSEKDVLFSLRYIGYCAAKLPPESIKTEYVDFVNFAKFQICQERGILMKDPIWEKYADEDILVEYFAILYYKSEDAANDFAALVSGEDTSLMDWFTKMETENKKEVEDLVNSMDENLSFSPIDILGD